MKFHVAKYYKRTVKSFFLSKYFYYDFNDLNGCSFLVPLIFKNSKLQICNLVCGFVFFYLTGKYPFLYYKNVLRSGKKRKKYKFLGCFLPFENDFKYFLFFLFTRRLNIYSFLGSYNLKKKHNGLNFYKLVITNLSYILKKPGLC